MKNFILILILFPTHVWAQAQGRDPNLVLTDLSVRGAMCGHFHNAAHSMGEYEAAKSILDHCFVSKFDRVKTGVQSPLDRSITSRLPGLRYVGFIRVTSSPFGDGRFISCEGDLYQSVFFEEGVSMVMHSVTCR